MSRNTRPISWRRCPSRNDDLSGLAAAGNRPPGGERQSATRRRDPAGTRHRPGAHWILAFGETTLSADEATTLEALLQRRQRGEPIAHLVGQREFWSLPLFVSPATLIPRPDTECLVEQALARLPVAPCRILDLGTGTGAIALALASERPDCEITAVDVMPDAVALALRNAAHLGIANVTIRQSDWFAALAGQRFAMIVSNPPISTRQTRISPRAMCALSR